jgi:GMP synthase (glutamine-hydrolysing)
MKTLVIMHEESEGPGTLEDYISSRGNDIHISKLYEGDEIPDYLDYFDAIVTMGGHRDIYDENIHPFILEEILCLEHAVKSEIPVLGFGLGAQLLAKACGANVTRASEKELGFLDVSLTYMGLRDPLFAGMPLVLPVFLWHEDTFEIPTGGLLLATSYTCPHQAFRFHKAYGLQFHVEIDYKTLSDWLERSELRDEILGRFKKMEHDFIHLATKLYANFMVLIS